MKLFPLNTQNANKELQHFTQPLLNVLLLLKHISIGNTVMKQFPSTNDHQCKYTASVYIKYKILYNYNSIKRFPLSQPRTLWHTY